MHAKIVTLVAILFVGILLSMQIVLGSKQMLPQFDTKTSSLSEIPYYPTNTPYYTPGRDVKSDEDRENAAENDTSRMVGPEMHVALKNHGDAEQYGYATIAMIHGKLHVSVHTEDSETPLEVKQPTIIYKGSCLAKGNALYTLTPLYDGKSDTSLDISMDELLQQLPLALYVHRGEGDLTSYNSCGDLAGK